MDRFENRWPARRGDVEHGRLRAAALFPEQRRRHVQPSGRSEAGLADQLGGLNLIQADYNNDGCMDILVLRGGWEFPMRKSLLRKSTATARSAT